MAHRKNKLSTSAFAKSLSLIPDLVINTQVPTGKLKTELAALKKSTHYIFAGTGSSLHSALWGSELFNHYGLESRAIEAFDLLQNPTLVSTHSTLILISHRGAKGLTGALIDKLNPAQKRRTLLLCGEGSSEGKTGATLYTSPAEISQAHSVSLLGTFARISTLAQLLSPNAYKESLYKLSAVQEMAKIIGAPKPKPVLPKRHGRLHFVGAGPFFAIAKEAALKAMEMAYSPALCHHLEGFLHGPLTAIEPADTVFILGTSAHTHNRRSTEHKRIRATLRALKILKARGVRISAPQHPLLPAHWQAACALVKLQRIILDLSQQLRRNPDTNRQEYPSYKRAAKAAAFVL